MLEASVGFSGVVPILEDLLEPPNMKNVSKSFDYLHYAGMITVPADEGALTSIGRLAGNLPVDLQLGRLIAYGVALGKCLYLESTDTLHVYLLIVEAYVHVRHHHLLTSSLTLILPLLRFTSLPLLSSPLFSSISPLPFSTTHLSPSLRTLPFSSYFCSPPLSSHHSPSLLPPPIPSYSLSIPHLPPHPIPFLYSPTFSPPSLRCSSRSHYHGSRFVPAQEPIQNRIRYDTL